MSGGEYNPLDYANLTRNCVTELMRRGPFKLPLDHKFSGAGVYALFYTGSNPAYAKIRTADASWPIYVGKAVPPGARKGGGGKASSPLQSRIGQHVASIEATKTLRIEDFVCRYLVVTPLWITMSERFLLEHYRPVWNLCLEGFGNHNPGSGRLEGEITWWDAFHPGRHWSGGLRQTRTTKDAEKRLGDFLNNYSMRSVQEVMAERPADADLLSSLNIPDDEEA